MNDTEVILILHPTATVECILQPIMPQATIEIKEQQCSIIGMYYNTNRPRELHHRHFSSCERAGGARRENDRPRSLDTLP